jgi:hypothetical protein
MPDEEHALSRNHRRIQMRPRNLLFTALLTVAVIGLFGMVLVTSIAPGTARATDLLAMHDHTTGSGYAGPCHRFDDTHLALAAAYAEVVLELDDVQTTALDPMLDVIRRWHDDAGAYCGDGLQSAPTLLRSAAGLLQRTSTAAHELLPAFDAFYATLTAEQQERLNSWIRERHGHRA